MLDMALQNNNASDFIRELFPSLPEGWTGKRLKYLSPIRFSNVDKKSDPDQNEVLLCNYVDAYKNNFITSKLDFMKATATPEEIRKFSLLPNDVLITKDSETADDIGVPSFIPEKIDNLVCGYHLAVLRVFPILMGKYLFRYLQSTLTASFFEKRANGITRFAIGMDTVGNCPVIFPALQKQHTIASFLDQETSRIDALISKKEKQIELLQEERQAIITHAVTKGLEPSAKMKDSGVEWIGKIPVGWEIRRLKYCLQMPLKYGANESAEINDPGLPRYIRITDFDDSGTLREETFKSLPENVAKDYLLQEGDILFARSGATVGKTFQFKDYKGKACFAGYLIKASVNDSTLNTDFLFYFTKSSSYESWKNSIFIQATIQNIGADKYDNLIVPLPPIGEQKVIISYLKEETSNIDRLRERIVLSISLLQEYRSSLITAAVSGQIDVSKMKSKAPQ